jgi:4a-hydroxytetrahydrobiopterin dehydratase
MEEYRIMELKIVWVEKYYILNMIKIIMDWNIEGNVLVKEFEFSNFNEAVEFVNKILPIAEDLGHHPDLLIHSYKKVKVMLSSHDSDKVTDKDYYLAKKIDNINI